MRRRLKRIGLVLLVGVKSMGILAQSAYRISGMITDEHNSPVSYSTVALIDRTDSSLVTGTISDTTGHFELFHYQLGSFYVTVSFVGYEPVTISLEIGDDNPVDLGVITLPLKQYEITEARIVGERTRARQYTDQTTYYVNQTMRQSSSTGIDMIQQVPGIQVDLFKHITLQGKQNILVLVNGVERDADFLNQLNSDRIDKIEVSINPGAKFRSDISGVVNIILKKEKSSGIGGHVYAEVPVKANEVYSFPSASLNYTNGNINLYTSYSGEFSYFDIEATNRKEIFAFNDNYTLVKSQSLNQKYGSHKLYLGLDYLFNDRNQLSIYGFANPVSNEFDGKISMVQAAGDSIMGFWESVREDTDIHRSFFSSVYYKHLFDSQGTELDLDLRYYGNRGHNRIDFTNDGNGGLLASGTSPTQQLWDATLNYRLPLNGVLTLETGLKESMQVLGDDDWQAFYYREIISAGYASLAWDGRKIQLNGGLRIEHADLLMTDMFHRSINTVLPHASAKFDLTKNSNVKLAYRRSADRPTIYWLNPNPVWLDPYTVRRGDPRLNPLIRGEVSLDWSTLVKNNYISVGVYHSHEKEIIETITTRDDSLFFKATSRNAGDIGRSGMKLLGSLQPHSGVSVNPYINVFYVRTYPNERTRADGIGSKSMVAMESGLSMAVLFKYDIALSATMRYNSAYVHVQGNHFEDILYFISLDKTFLGKLKFGVTAAVPFKKEFTYQGYERQGNGFSEYSEDNIQFSVFPFWFTLKYTFAAGKEVRQVERGIDFKERKVRKDF